MQECQAADKPSRSPGWRNLRCPSACLPAAPPEYATYRRVTRDFDLKIELYFALRERCGSRDDWPAGFNTARHLLCAIPLDDRELHRFLCCARQASTYLRERARPTARLYKNCLGSAFDDEYGPDVQDQGHEAAWHVTLAIHGLLGQEAFDQFVDCVTSALEPEREAVGA